MDIGCKLDDIIARLDRIENKLKKSNKGVKGGVDVGRKDNSEADRDSK